MGPKLSLHLIVLGRPDEGGLARADREQGHLHRTSHGGTANSAPVAVVTGANRGIGLEVVRQLAGRGWTVVLGSRDLARGRAAADRLTARRSGMRSRDIDVRVVRLDVADQASIDSMAAWVTAELRRCDALVNNAAVDYDTDQSAATADLDRVREAMRTNLFGAWATTLALLPLLRAAPHPRVVNVSSEAGSLASMGAGAPGYSVSKAALNALTVMLAAELRDDDVLVNAVCPGWTATDMGGGGRPVAAGAAGVTWAVLLTDDGPTGGFYRDGRPLPW
jgi:NAD(P)-dependent dehydrogenase (short-subunit alcohol dehydrogenase family)